jgi:hypothetical protein
MRLALFLFYLMLLPAPLLAGNGMSCHCFQDRAYSPDKPGAADQYILATTQNSLISALFGMSKKSIVAAKMSGTPGADLWLAGYVASRTGMKPEQLLERRRAFDSWSDFLVTLDGFPEWLEEALAPPMLGRKPHAELVSALVDLQLETRLGQQPETLRELRRKGASDQELILLAFVSQSTQRPADAIFLQQRSRALPWDMLLHQLDIAPRQIDGMLRRLLER